MSLATSQRKLSEAITLAKTRGPETLRTALVDAAAALDRGELAEAGDRLDDALASLIPKNRLRDLRLASRFTQKEVAGRVGVEPVDVRRWEHGKEEIPADHRLALAGLFRVSEPFLAGEA